MFLRYKDTVASFIDTVSANKAIERKICSSTTILIEADILHLFLLVERASEIALSYLDIDR